MNGQYEVLVPWADVDPIPLRGISPRIQSLAGKKIGIFVNPKRAAMPIAESIIKRLGAMFPDAQTIVFRDTEAQSVLARRLRPEAHDVLLRADVDRVPAMIF